MNFHSSYSIQMLTFVHDGIHSSLEIFINPVVCVATTLDLCFNPSGFLCHHLFIEFQLGFLHYSTRGSNWNAVHILARCLPNPSLKELRNLLLDDIKTGSLVFLAPTHKDLFRTQYSLHSLFCANLITQLL